MPRHTLASPQPTTCTNRSTSFQLRGCNGCGGSVQIKVYQCRLHGKVILAKDTTLYKTCSGCVDRTTRDE